MQIYLLCWIIQILYCPTSTEKHDSHSHNFVIIFSDLEPCMPEFSLNILEVLLTKSLIKTKQTQIIFVTYHIFYSLWAFYFSSYMTSHLFFLITEIYIHKNVWIYCMCYFKHVKYRQRHKPSIEADSRGVCSGLPPSHWGFLSALVPSSSGSWTQSTNVPLRRDGKREELTRWRG